MDIEVRVEEVVEALDDFLSDITSLANPNGSHGYEGQLEVDGRLVTLSVVLGYDFPLSLPRYYVKPWDALGRLPHVLDNGQICFLSPEGTVEDVRLQGDIVRESLQLAVDVLVDGMTGANRLDFMDEFQAHWDRLNTELKVRTIFTPTDQAKLLDLLVDDKGVIWIGDSPGDFDRFSPTIRMEGAGQQQSAVYLPLKEEVVFDPPWRDQSFWSISKFRANILENLTDAGKGRLKSIRRRTRGDALWVIIGVPRTSEGRALVGVKFSGYDSSTHPLSPSGNPRQIEPSKVERLDQEALIYRGGGQRGVETTRALVVGAGAVGGRVISELAQSGIRNITVVDHDNFSPENTFRHHLGQLHWGKNKAFAMKLDIELSLPYVKVTSVEKSIHNAIESGDVSLDNFDLVVFALGSPTIELAMNQMVMNLTSEKLVIFTWVEPLGIGGHALLVWPGKPGCFRCLYKDSNDPKEHFTNRASFAGTGQHFGKDLTGCGSLYTPYGSTDAAMTSVTAAQLALDALTGVETGSPLRSWKGNARSFLSQGFRLSNRYHFSAQDLIDQQYSYMNDDCPVCSQFSSKDVQA